PRPTATKKATPEPTTGDAAPEPQFQEFDAANFSDPTVIDNEWYPLAPGTKWVFEGTTTEGNEVIPHRLEFTVTDLTKEIQGVRTVVAWIEDFSDGELIEKEIAFYAQDNDGNVWYLGEHPEEYEKGGFVKALTWIAGFQDARPGIKMWAEPEVGMRPYFQGWGPAVDWTDYAQVDKVLGEACVPLNCYEDALLIAESSLGETDVFQLKHYARGVGEIRTGWRGEPETPEGLQLVELTVLSPEALAVIRAEALALEAHAYEISDVYAQTAPAE
ncbi:MAG: hypothetical protein ACRD1T_05400, partial [Acidimicrobiia bacterium]